MYRVFLLLFLMIQPGLLPAVENTSSEELVIEKKQLEMEREALLRQLRQQQAEIRQYREMAEEKRRQIRAAEQQGR